MPWSERNKKMQKIRGAAAERLLTQPTTAPAPHALGPAAENTPGAGAE